MQGRVSLSLHSTGMSETYTSAAPGSSADLNYLQLAASSSDIPSTYCYTLMWMEATTTLYFLEG